MKVGTFAKACAIGASAAIITTGFFAAPAMADPSGTPAVGASTLAGYGSDTTQDVMNALAAAVNANSGDTAALASYDALGATTISNPKGATVGGTVPRANGSGDGLNLLRTAIGHAGTQNIKSGTTKTSISATTEAVGPLVDFARSSSDRADSNNATDGVFSYVPFAKDAVSLAVNGSDAAMVALGSHLTQGASGDTDTTASIYSIYHCLARYVYTNTSSGLYVGVGGDVSSDAAITSTEIKPLLPASGSGTRKYFVTTVAGYSADSASLISSTNHNTCLKDVDVTDSNAAINEHDGTAIANNGTGAVGPFSIPQWVAQKASTTSGSAASNAGVTDRRHSVVLLGATNASGVAQAALTSAGTTNPNFPFLRTVFNVLPYKLVRDNTKSQWTAFNGSNSSSNLNICKYGSTIEAMGFIKLNTTANPSSIADCGFIGNRWGAPVGQDADTTTTVSTDYNQIAQGDSVAVTVAAGDGSAAGGANVYSDAARTSPLAIGLNINEGDTDTTTNIATSAAAGSTLSFYGNYESNSLLAAPSGISAPAKVKVVNPYVVTLADQPGRVAIGSKNTIKATIALAASNPGAKVGGWATLIVNGADVQSTYLIKRNASTVSFVWTPAAAGNYDVAVEFAPDGSSPSLYGNDTTDITVGNLTTTVSLPATGRTGFSGANGNVISTTGSATPALPVVLAKSGANIPTGTVKVLISTGRTGGTVIATGTVDSTGKVTVTLPRASKWKTTGTAAGVTRYLNVVYSGDAKFFTASASYKVVINNN